MNITKRQLKRIIREMVESRMQQHPSDELIEELGLHDYIDIPPTRVLRVPLPQIFSWRVE